jgi:DNA-nicking Smr family endonuclease
MCGVIATIIIIVITAASDEASVLDPDPGIVRAAAAQAQLEQEERALWESVAKQTKPLRKKPRAAKAHVPSDAEMPPAVKPAGPQKQLPPASTRRTPRPALPPAAPPLAPLGRRERSQLSRGRKEIDARLDLHGMTQTRAHRALFGFLQRAHGEGLTFVLVITGKGKLGAESERGAAPPGAAVAEPAGISFVGGRFRGSAYRPWRRGRALCQGQAIENLSVKTEMSKRSHDPDTGDQCHDPAANDGLWIIGRYQRHFSRGGQGLDRVQDQEHADRPVRNPP